MSIPATTTAIATPAPEAQPEPAPLKGVKKPYLVGVLYYGGIDREHDQADRAAGRRIACPLLALWAAGGALDTWYGEEGGPLALWRVWADDVLGHAVQGGHFFPEEASGETAEALGRFLGDSGLIGGPHSG